MSRTHFKYGAALILLLCVPVLLAGCWPDEWLYDQSLCDDVAMEYCDKHFDCGSNEAASWGSRANCYDIQREFCATAVDTSCDFGDDALRECRDRTRDVGCYSGVPQACTEVFTCY